MTLNFSCFLIIGEKTVNDTFTTVSKPRQSSVDSSGIAGQLFEAIQSGKVKKLAEFIKKGVNITGSLLQFAIN